jgi:hypothetical protein
VPFILKNTVIAEILKDFILFFMGFICTTTLLGFVKAAIAGLLGDKTPEIDGFLSLNPQAHFDLVDAATVMAIFISIQYICFGSSSYSLIPSIIVFMFFKSPTYLMRFDESAKSVVRLAIISLLGLISSAVLFFFSMAVTLAFFWVSDPKIKILTGVLDYIAAFSFIRLIVNLFPPIPPSESFYIIRPFLGYKAEKFLESLRDNIFASVISFVFFILCMRIFLPLLITVYLALMNSLYR